MELRPEKPRDPEIALSHDPVAMRFPLLHVLCERRVAFQWHRYFLRWMDWSVRTLAVLSMHCHESKNLTLLGGSETNAYLEIW